MAKKVFFGFSDLYVGTYTVDSGGNVSLGSPYHQKGAVSLTMDSDSDQFNEYADNIVYWSTETNSGRASGTLEVELFDDSFKTMFLNYVQLDDGGLARIKGMAKPNIYMMFEYQTDDPDAPCRIIIYNGVFGAIKADHSTIEETPQPQHETIPVTFYGDNGTGITDVEYVEGDSGFATLFSNPPVPMLPSASS